MEHAGKLGVPVGNVPRAICERCDDISELLEALVDVDTLLHDRSFRACLLDPLGARQIDEVEFSCHEPRVLRLANFAAVLGGGYRRCYPWSFLLVEVVDLVLLDRDGKNRVRPGGRIVHVCRGSCAHDVALFKCHHHLLVGRDFDFFSTVYADFPVFFTNLHGLGLLILPLAGGDYGPIKQIQKLAVVDFEELDLYYDI